MRMYGNLDSTKELLFFVLFSDVQLLMAKMKLHKIASDKTESD